MNRSYFHTRTFRRIHLSVFRYWWTKNGLAGPKSFRAFGLRAEPSQVVRRLGTLFTVSGLDTKKITKWRWERSFLARRIHHREFLPTFFRMPSFGQIVIGPPGSGKSTFCAGMCEFLTNLGRKAAVVNLDPANDSLSYNCALDISTLVTLNDVMENLKLGPNGGLIYCIEYLEKNIDWLEKKLKELKGHYFLFDCPGQVELYTHHTSVRNVVRQLEKWDFRVSETRGDSGPNPYPPAWKIGTGPPCTVRYRVQVLWVWLQSETKCSWVHHRSKSKLDVLDM